MCICMMYVVNSMSYPCSRGRLALLSHPADLLRIAPGGGFKTRSKGGGTGEPLGALRSTMEN